VIRHAASSELGRDVRPCFFAGVHDSNQLAACRLRILLRVEPPEIPHTDDCCSDFFHGGAIMPAPGKRSVS
jgi:hypothetical protein